MASDPHIRILGVDPYHKGFGFALLDTPDFLVDWGLAKVFGKTTDAFLARAEQFVDRYRPDVVAFPAPHDYTNRPKLRSIGAGLVILASARMIRVSLVSRAEVVVAFPGCRTKYERAAAAALAFPELAADVPGVRKPWMSEHERVNLFDALALAVSCNLRQP